MNLQQNIIWFAGLFEGEGTTGLFKYRRKSGHWRITTYFMICNNDPFIIEASRQIMNEIGASTYILQRERKGDENWNLNYQIACKNMDGVYKLLKAIHPYLKGNKKAVSEMTMRFIENRNFGNVHEKGLLGTRKYSDEDFELVKKIKEINQRGKKKKTSEPPETLRRAIMEQLLKKSGMGDKVQTSMRIGDNIPPRQTYREDK